MSRRINVGQRMKEAVKFIKKIDTKKMILVAGISLMSFFSFGKFVYAAPEVSVQCKNMAATTGNVKYQLRMAECEYTNLASDIEFHKGNIDGDSNKVTPEILEEMSNGDIVAVVEVPAETTNLVIKDKNANENETTVVLSGETVSIPVATSIEVKDNLIEYNSPEYGKYIHVTLESMAKIWSIKDADDKDRIWLKEKEEDNLVTLKYILKDDETNPDKLYFTVYDVFGNSKKVDIKDALIQVEFNAKNVDGSTFVFKASKSFQKKLEGQDTASTFELVNIKTGALEDIEMHTSNEQGDTWENNYKYVNVPEGTTKLLLTYKVLNPEYNPEAPGDIPKYIENITEKFVVPLWLDVTDPEGIYYKINKEQVLSSYEINGDIIENNYNRYVIERVKGNIRKYTTDILEPENENQQVRVRAYVNNTTKKCIVEVRDMQSGIDKIELCKLNTAAEEGASDEIKYSVIKGADVTAANYNSHGNLEASVLHLFDLSTAADFSEKIAAVKVTDGLENYMYIPVEKSASGDGATSNYGADADTLVLAKLIEEHVDGKTIYKIVAQDYKAGLWKIERDGVNTPLVEFDEADKLKINSAKRDFTQGDGVVEYTDHEGESGQEDENNIKITIDGDRYEQYTLRRVTRTIEQKGLPVLTVYDALGNTRQVTFDELAFGCTYATYNETDSLAVNIKETRGIWKITAQIVDADAGEEPVKNSDEPERPGPKPCNEGEEPENPGDTRPAAPEGEDPGEGQEGHDAWVEEKTAYDEWPEKHEAYQEYQAWVEKNTAYNNWLNEDTGDEDEHIYPNKVWKAWNDAHRHEYTLEVFAGNDEPTRLIKTYQVPAGVVEKITVYHTRGKDDLNNVINETPRGEYCAALTSLASIKNEIATAENKQEVLEKLINVTPADLKVEDEKITGATVRAYHGIKRVSYNDGTVMDFYRELPTRLFVNCKLGDEFNGATVIDATGCPITITEDNVTLDYIDIVAGQNNEALSALKVITPA